MKDLKPYLEKYKNPRILDIGSGKGDFIKFIDFINQDYQEIIGIDIVDYLAEIDQFAFQNNPKIRWMDLDVLETNFPKNSFDIISLSNTLHHMTDIESVFKRMSELLKPDGILLVVEVMSSNDLSNQQLSHQILHSFAAKIDHEIGKIHAQIFTKTNILETINQFSSLAIDKYWELNTKEFDKEIMLDDLYKVIDILLNKVKDSEKYELYKKEAMEIKEYLSKNGFSYSKTLCVVLKRTDL